MRMGYDDEKEKDTEDETADLLEGAADEAHDEDDDVPETDDFEERDY